MFCFDIHVMNIFVRTLLTCSKFRFCRHAALQWCLFPAPLVFIPSPFLFLLFFYFLPLPFRCVQIFILAVEKEKRFKICRLHFNLINYPFACCPIPPPNPCKLGDFTNWLIPPIDFWPISLAEFNRFPKPLSSFPSPI